MTERAQEASIHRVARQVLPEGDELVPLRHGFGPRKHGGRWYVIWEVSYLGGGHYEVVSESRLARCRRPAGCFNQEREYVVAGPLEHGEAKRLLRERRQAEPAGPVLRRSIMEVRP